MNNNWRRIKDPCTVKEAMEIAGVSGQRIRILCKSGRIDAEKFGHDWMLERQSVIDWNADEKNHSSSNRLLSVAL